MMLEPAFLFTIVLLGLATYSTRIMGYWLLRGVIVRGRMKAAMDAVPPAVLMAVITPDVFLQGTAAMLAGGLTLVVAVLRAPLLVVIAMGMGSVVAFRMVVG